MKAPTYLPMEIPDVEWDLDRPYHPPPLWILLLLKLMNIFYREERESE